MPSVITSLSFDSVISLITYLLLLFVFVSLQTTFDERSTTNGNNGRIHFLRGKFSSRIFRFNFILLGNECSLHSRFISIYIPTFHSSNVSWRRAHFLNFPFVKDFLSSKPFASIDFYPFFYSFFSLVLLCASYKLLMNTLTWMFAPSAMIAAAATTATAMQWRETIGRWPKP